MPPKRKAAAKLSNLTESDNEDATQAQEPRDEERPTKKQRGRPRSKSAELKPPIQSKNDTTAAPSKAPEAAPKRGTRRGRPRGSRGSLQSVNQELEEQKEPEEGEEDAGPHVPESAPASNDELVASQPATRSTRSAKSAKPTTTRGRRKATAEKQVKTDGEFQYTPRSTRQHKSPVKGNEEAEQSTEKRRKADPQSEPEEEVSEGEKAAPDIVEETFVQEEHVESRPISMSPAKRRQSTQRPLQSSPQKSNAEPELRRKIGELTKKYDTLESRYRTLKEIGVVEANANMEKLRKQCEAMTNASNNLVAGLKAELEAQKALGQQSRTLQKQLQERDAEIAQMKLQVQDATSQLSSAQTEVKALQTKLAAARNTAASLESAAAKVPGSAIKGGNNRANAAASAEAAQAAQFAQLKEDLYTDLTGLIIRDVKKGDSDNLYDCIQTGINGTLHFKLAVPHVSSANFENAEFQYVPLLDENRDRELIDILPEYLTVDITFVRQQASKFYTRVIDALTKRRTSTGN
ncbi:chromosome segregation protein Csm1/Pcs1-domain-containing protein [Aspergillus tamarii]|uniref:Chromosome segregation protein Csm1/Pcs1-domain-containing protein n=1 Tax=Aspergillus tamarii TaxID=41984 RepID=A0A5N6UTK4_ASPTM|nr:chromosome segregation protein Csm1/Pcs1-domain-containing protein [Aspergillus tamarii]